MIRYFLLLMLMIVTLSLTACEKPISVSYTSVCTQANVGKLIETTGYLSDGNGVFCSNTRSGKIECSYSLTETPKAKVHLLADIPVGTSANTAEELKGSYKSEDVKIHDNNNTLVSPTQQVKVTSKVSTIYSAEEAPNKVGCTLTVKKIEKQ